MKDELGYAAKVSVINPWMAKINSACYAKKKLMVEKSTAIKADKRNIITSDIPTLISVLIYLKNTSYKLLFRC